MQPMAQEEAERVLETKSGNSARALQTERGDGDVCAGGTTIRHTHSFSGTDIDL